MTTPTQQYKLTMDDVKAAAKRRAASKQVLLKVDDDLQRYLLMVIANMMKTTGSADIFAVLHTLVEVSIEAGRELGRQEQVAAWEGDSGGDHHDCA